MLGNKDIFFQVFRIAFIAMALAVGFDLLFQHVLIPAQQPFANVRKLERIISDDHPEDIPIFGSSIARRAYYCDSIGPGFYNYGMAGSLFGSIYPLLKIQLEKDNDYPIILDFDQHTFLHSEYVQLDLSNYVPHVSNPHIQEMLQFHGKEDWQHEVPGFRYFGLYTDYLRDLLKPSLEREELISRGGVFYPEKKKAFQRFLAKRERMIEDKRELDERLKEGEHLLTEDEKKWHFYLDAILNFHPDSLMVSRYEALMYDNPYKTFVLIYSPQSEVKLRGLENYGDIQEFLSGLKDRHPNLRVLDYSKAGYGNEYYRDSGHLNIAGAKKFSALISDDLERILGRR